MKLNLLILFFAAAIKAAQGYRSRILHDLENIYEDEALEALEGTRDEALHKRLIDPLVQEDPDSGNNTCNCGTECDKLHVTRLPHNVRDVDKYLSYENFPVLCRDASAILLPPKEEDKPQKSYVCKQVFDCCRSCNHVFYTCLKLPDATYGFCMRGAYKCMCDCIDNKSFQELPYKPTPAS